MLYLILIPIVMTALSLLVYRFQSKQREIFRLDMVQFVYLFFFTPIFFVWGKSFLFYLMRNELDFPLSNTEMFIVDTAYSVLFMFMVAALAIHSLTKTFWIKRYHNPGFDVFHLSEYFHLWWSHILIWGGGMLIISFVSIASIFFPQPLELSKEIFIATQSFGILGGMLLFFVIWMSDPGKGDFMKLMKVMMVFFTLIHILAYFLLNPDFNSNYVAYWFSLGSFITASVCGAFFERYERVSRFRRLFLHVGWGEHLVGDIFKKKK